MKNGGVREASLAGIDSVLIVVRPGLRRSFGAAIHVLDGQTPGGDGLVSLGDMSEEPFLSDGGGLSERCCCHLRCAASQVLDGTESAQIACCCRYLWRTLDTSVPRRESDLGLAAPG